MKKLFAILGVVLLLNGCNIPSTAGTDSVTAPNSEDTHVESSEIPIHYAVPRSLTSCGYTLNIPKDIGISDPNIENDALDIHPYDPPLYSAYTTSTEPAVGTENSGEYYVSVYGAESLNGQYLLIQPRCMYRTNTGDSSLSFSLLQVFRREELDQPNTSIRFLRPQQPLPDDERYFDMWATVDLEEYTLPIMALTNYIVYSDETIVVYDFFELSTAPPLESQLKQLSKEMRYEEYGVQVDWLIEVRDFILNEPGGVGRFIQKKQQ